MPVPRVFEAAAEPVESFTHVLSCLLALGGPATRAALVAELVGEELNGAGEATIRERRAFGEVEADIVVRDAERRWVLVVTSTLGFGVDLESDMEALYDALSGDERVIVVAITADRKAPEWIDKTRAGGREAHHKSWLRVRDWVQERPERGRAEGIDLFLLTEAEYFLTPRVAELYRLEGLMPHLAPELRPALANAFFDLNDLSPAPLIERTDRVAFPRTGDAMAELGLGDGALTIRLATSEAGPGFTADGGGTVLRVTDPAQYTAARSHVRNVARALLPARL